MGETTILFGAGADMLSNGMDFALSVIGFNENTMNSAIIRFYRELSKSAWCETYVYKKIEIDELVRSSIHREYLSGKRPIPSSQKKIEEEINNIISSASVRTKKQIIKSNTSYLDIIDGDFHTLINPKVFGKAPFWRAVNCFTRAYLCLVKDILQPKKATQKFYYDVLSAPYDTYEKMVDTIKTDKIRFDKDCYYKSIRNIGKENLHIVSTNYTPCCSVISGRDDIIHIHGRMDWFENPYEWTVVDAREAQENNKSGMERKLLFPYLAIQSGVKPIVEKRQITEYGKMVEAFDQAEKIIIVGYSINYDDNHINSIIRNAIMDKDKKKKVYVLYYEDAKDKPIADPDGETRRKLRIENKCSNLHVIRVGPENSLDKFKDLLSKG